MRQLRHRIVMAAGLLVLAGATTAALAQPQGAKRGQQAKTERSAPWSFGAARSVNRGPQQAQRTRSQARPSAAVAYSTVRVGGRLVREPVNAGGSFLPGFRVPQSWPQPQAPQRRAAAPSQPAGTVRHARTSRQAVRTQPASTHRASLAKVEPVPSIVSRYRPSALVAEARRYLGTNPTSMARLWCARFMNFVLKRVGQPGTGSDAAKSFAFYGRRISGPQYGAIAVMTRKGGGHVGIVTGVDRNGNPIVIAGNNGKRKVGVSVYPKRRVIAYVMPDGRAPAKASRLASARSSRTR